MNRRQILPESKDGKFAMAWIVWANGMGYSILANAITPGHPKVKAILWVVAMTSFAVTGWIAWRLYRE